MLYYILDTICKIYILSQQSIIPSVSLQPQKPLESAAAPTLKETVRDGVAGGTDDDHFLAERRKLRCLSLSAAPAVSLNWMGPLLRYESLRRNSLCCTSQLTAAAATA